MVAARQNTGSVLGKRSHQTTQVDAHDVSSLCDVENVTSLPTPDSTPNPKRAKTTVTLLDGDHNKENIPPFVLEAINASPSSSRLTRSLRRTSTMVHQPSFHPGTPRRYASTSNLRQATVVTPATSLSQLSLATPPPSPPTILLPLHARARALLRPTCNDGPQMAGREKERSKIEVFLRDFIAGTTSHEEHTALYISGSPGTGKTALVNMVLNALENDIVAQNVLVLAVNCMALGGVDAVWQQLATMVASGPKSKGRGNKTKEDPQQAVAQAFASSERKCIVVLDELDHIASSSQTLSPLFALAHACAVNLRLVGIANTHTLSSTSSTTFSVQSLAGVDTLHFAPYTPDQLLGILKSRLSPLSDGEAGAVDAVKKFLPLPTLTLLSKKIASQTGDVRAVFEVLRGAIDMAMNGVSSLDPLNTPTPAVTPSHILSALKAYAPAGKTAPAFVPSTAAPMVRKASDSETVSKIRELGLQQRLVLLATLLATRSTDVGVALGGSPAPSQSRTPVKRTQSSSSVQPYAAKTNGFELGQLHGFYTTILSRTENGVFTPVSRSEFGDLAGVLEVVGLLTLSSAPGLPTTPRKAGKKAFSRTMSFTGGSSTQEVRFVEGVRLDEVARGLGLGADDTPADAREEEVRAIFQREQARIAREAKARNPGASVVSVVGFEDAEEQ